MTNSCKKKTHVQNDLEITSDRFSGGFFGSLHLCFQLGGNASAVEAHGLKGNIQNDVIDAELIAEQDASNCLHDA